MHGQYKNYIITCWGEDEWRSWDKDKKIDFLGGGLS